MRAIVKNDQILKLTSKENLGVEIGDIPKGIGFGRLRFDGEKLVDLAKLTEIWVCKNFNLHAYNVNKSCQLVQMTYKDRKNLINDNGIIRVKTPKEIKQEIKNNNRLKKQARIKRKIKKEFDSLIDYQIKRDKCLWATIEYLLNDNTKHIQFVRNNLDKVKNILGID